MERDRGYRRYVKDKKFKRRSNIIDSAGGFESTMGYFEYNKVDGVWVKDGSHIKYPNSSARQRFLKKRSNRIVRRNKDAILNGNSYRRKFDYQWELF